MEINVEWKSRWMERMKGINEEDEWKEGMNGKD